jgi:hypothetical protein
MFFTYLRNETQSNVGDFTGGVGGIDQTRKAAQKKSTERGLISGISEGTHARCMPLFGGTDIPDRTSGRFAHFLEAREMSGHQVS